MTFRAYRSVYNKSGNNLDFLQFGGTSFLGVAFLTVTNLESEGNCGMFLAILFVPSLQCVLLSMETVVRSWVGEYFVELITGSRLVSQEPPCPPGWIMEHPYLPLNYTIKKTIEPNWVNLVAISSAVHQSHGHEDGI